MNELIGYTITVGDLEVTVEIKSDELKEKRIGEYAKDSAK